MSLLTLNVDCLLLICEYLNVQEHVKLYQTCARLQNVVKNFYQRKQKVTLYDELWVDDQERMRSFLVDFQQSIYQSVNEVSMRTTVKGLQVLHSLQLNKITKLYVICDGKEAVLNRAIKGQSHQLKSLTLNFILAGKNIDLQCAFPNLTNLCICGRSNISLNATKFPKLSKLTLIMCEVTKRIDWNFKQLTVFSINNVKITNEQLNAIFAQLCLKKFSFFEPIKSLDGISQCQTLEELELTVDLLKKPIDNLLTLKNLRKLTYTRAFGSHLLPFPVHSRLIYHSLAIEVDDSMKMCEEIQMALESLEITEKLKHLNHLRIMQRTSAFSEDLLNCVLKLLQLCETLQTLELGTPSWATAKILEQAVHIFESRKQTVLIKFWSDGDWMHSEFYDVDLASDAARKLKQFALNDFMDIKITSREKDFGTKVECDILALNEYNKQPKLST